MYYNEKVEHSIAQESLQEEEDKVLNDFDSQIEDYPSPSVITRTVSVDDESTHD